MGVSKDSRRLRYSSKDVLTKLHELEIRWRVKVSEGKMHKEVI